MSRQTSPDLYAAWLRSLGDEELAAEMELRGGVRQTCAFALGALVYAEITRRELAAGGSCWTSFTRAPREARPAR